MDNKSKVVVVACFSVVFLDACPYLSFVSVGSLCLLRVLEREDIREINRTFPPEKKGIAKKRFSL